MKEKHPMLFHFCLVSLFAAVLPFVSPSTILATEILIFSLAAIGCNLLLGYTGLLSFGQALFFGTGAYVASLLSNHWGLDIVSVLLITSVAGALIAVVVGYFSIRRTGIYFVMLTLAFGQLGYYIAFMAEPITGGEDGLLNVIRPDVVIPLIEPIALSSDSSYYVLAATVFVIVFLLLQRLVESPLGSVLTAIKQNESRADAIGYQTRWYKIAVFAFSGATTAIAGGLYAFMLNFAPLSNIDLEISEQILFMCVLGGMGTLYGSIAGAAVFLLASDFFAELWPRWMLLLGLMLIFVMLYAPGGIWKGITVFTSRISGMWAKNGRV